MLSDEQLFDAYDDAYDAARSRLEGNDDGRLAALRAVERAVREDVLRELGGGMDDLRLTATNILYLARHSPSPNEHIVAAIETALRTAVAAARVELKEGGIER